ncbi:beta-ketoacyl-[acyl-carrier-protein] synthase family protein [Streptomyces sp. CA-250714]|uniref:beta-ketoacyl-[acyl-carrier-protein] synthase family protein n=1 Tax=Streptomyces sp. CA-250714 TaxID=3240060 RepID=UPI003D8EEFFD
MHRTEVAVTGLGLVTAAGGGPGEFWDRLCTGRPTAAPDPLLTALRCSYSCQAAGFEPEKELGGRLSRRLHRFAQLALVAARRAVVDAELDPADARAERVGVVLGVGSNSLQGYGQEYAHLARGHAHRVSPAALPRSVPNMAAGEIAIDLGVRGPNFVTSSACASGATALGVARDLVRSGSCDVVLAGGSESGRDPMTATGFGQLGVLSAAASGEGPTSCAFARDRDGFVLGEGAAVLVLESAAHARRRQAPVRAWLRGYGASADAHHPTAPHPRGQGAEDAVRAALADAGCPAREVGHVNAHGTGTVEGDRVEAAVLDRVFGDAAPPVVAVKGLTGHALGASGAIEAAATVLALQHQRLPPAAEIFDADPELGVDLVVHRPRAVAAQTALTCSFGFGGQNAALLFTAA